MQKIGKASFISRIEKVYLEEEPVSDVVTIEGSSFDQSDMCNKCRLSIVSISTETDSKGVIDREMQRPNSRPRCGLKSVDDFENWIRFSSILTGLRL